jgi:hypothetical protein
MTDELRQKAAEFAKTDEKIIAACPDWIKRLHSWAIEESKKG